ESLLNEHDIQTVHDAMKYRFRPGQVRLIDDLLLNRFGKEHIEATAETGTRRDRRQRLSSRLKALRALRKQDAKDNN
ncbi:MAG TPA: GTP pyrophosphokinase family protein, partial [Corynebacterium sp.]|nr:GTP pyrophosphokinase family protein [Corynebacterium sp.]